METVDRGHDAAGASPALPPDPLARSLDFFKALANEQRLKILGWLAGRQAAVEEIASGLDLRPATVSHHLRVLREAGLIAARKEGQYRIYGLQVSELRRQSRELTRLESFRAGAGPFPEGEYEGRVLDAFVSRGRLRSIPAQRKKRDVVLRWLASQFSVGERYPEAEVNRILGRRHPDFCTLRRELVMAGLLRRERGIYWRLEA